MNTSTQNHSAPSLTGRAGGESGISPLNSKTAPKAQRPERIIQFGEGNFLRAFIDWIVWQMDQRTDFNASVVIVQPIAQGMADRLQAQDCLYHVNLQGLIDGQPVNSLELIDSVSRTVNPYTDHAAFLALAEQPDIRFVISNTTEATTHRPPPTLPS